MPPVSAKSMLRPFVSRRVEQKVRRSVARPLARSLNALAFVYGSDKRTQNYVPAYTRHMSGRRRHVSKVLEIGVGGYTNPNVGGASLRMWRSYFPNAEVIGIDIVPKVIDEPRIRFIQCDQSSRDQLEQIAALGPYDVIIDDGSHIQQHVVLTFETLYPVLNPGGVYVIEDLATAYTESTGGGPPGTEGTGLSIARMLLDEVNREGIPNADLVLDEQYCDVGAIHAYASLLFVERRGGSDPALR